MTPPRLRHLGLCLSLGVVAVLAGCGTSRPDAASAGATVNDFYRAIADDDGPTACAFVAPVTRESLEDHAGQSCGEAILEGDVGDTLRARADGASVSDSRVAGRQAQVVLTTDVVFLTVSGDHWLITAAGCDPRPRRPYDCALEGS